MTETPSARLRRILEEGGLRQEDLAAMTGIGRGTINGYVTGRLRLGYKNATRIEDALGVDHGYLGVNQRRVARDEAIWKALEALAERVAALEDQP